MSGSETISVTGGAIISLEVPIKFDTDPTGVTPTFGVSTDSATVPGSYSNGSWNGSYNSTTDVATARTPTLGASGATITLTAGTTYLLWWKLATLGGETPAEIIGTIRAV